MEKPKLFDSDAPQTAAPDPFDIASLRLNPSFLETAGVKKLLTTVPARGNQARRITSVSIRRLSIAKTSR